MTRARDAARHCTEEELLLRLLGEPELAAAREVPAGHVEGCRECGALLNELTIVLEAAAAWRVEQPDDAAWQRQRDAVLARIGEGRVRSRLLGGWAGVGPKLEALWDYALENPLPALGYVAAAVAFASERTITVFRLDEILPGTSELVELLKGVL